MGTGIWADEEVNYMCAGKRDVQQRECADHVKSTVGGGGRREARVRVGDETAEGALQLTATKASCCAT